LWLPHFISEHFADPQCSGACEDEQKMASEVCTDGSENVADMHERCWKMGIRFGQIYRALRKWNFLQVQIECATLQELQTLKHQLGLAAQTLRDALNGWQARTTAFESLHHFLFTLPWDVDRVQTYCHRPHAGGIVICDQVVPIATKSLQCQGVDFRLEVELFDWSNVTSESKTERSVLAVNLCMDHSQIGQTVCHEDAWDFCEGVFTVCYLLSNGNIALDKNTFSFAECGSPSFCGDSSSSESQRQLLDDGCITLVDEEFASCVRPLKVLFSMSLSKSSFQKSVDISLTRQQPNAEILRDLCRV
jgi:hypothetical protein